MTSKQQLRGSFGSLSDTLSFRFDPSFSQELAGRWLGVLLHAAAIGRQTARWNALPDRSDSFDPVIAALDDATRRLVLASSDAERLDALARADAALDSLDALLRPAGDAIA